jgi:hypothetical protein
MSSALCETVSSNGRKLDHAVADELQGHPKKRAFLAAYRETGNVRLACTAAQIGRSSHYRWLAQDRDYEVAFEQAKKDAVDVLEAEARRRAVEGCEEQVGWYKGEAGGTVRRYSDTLLIFLLKGAAPQKYRERMEVSGALKGLDFSVMTDEQLSRIKAGEHPYVVLAKTRAVLSGPSVSDKNEILQIAPAQEDAVEG